MRLFLSLILLSFLLTTPFRGDAGKMSVAKPVSNIENSTPVSKLPDYSVCDDAHAAAIVNFNHRNGSAPRYRFYSSIDFINTAALYNNTNFFYDNKHFVQPHLYCKRIGLKLLFPKHYFW